MLSWFIGVAGVQSVGYQKKDSSCRRFDGRQYTPGNYSIENAIGVEKFGGLMATG